MKTCTKCGEPKHFAKFNKRSRSPDGLTSRCKPCLRDDQRELRERRGDEINARRRAREADLNHPRKQWSRDWRAANAEREAARLRASRVSHPRRFKGYELRAAFNISVDQYETLLEAQGWGCAGCGTPKCPSGMALAVDHDHACCPETGKSCGQCIRGLLCGPCNMADALAGHPAVSWGVAS